MPFRSRNLKDNKIYELLIVVRLLAIGQNSFKKINLAGEQGKDEDDFFSKDNSSHLLQEIYLRKSLNNAQLNEKTIV